MAAQAVDDRTDDHQLVHHPGDLGEAFSDLDAGDFAGNRLEFAADFGRGFGLDFPHVLMGRTAAEIHIDNGLVRQPCPRCRLSSQDIEKR